MQNSQVSRVQYLIKDVAFMANGNKETFSTLVNVNNISNFDYSIP